MGKKVITVYITEKKNPDDPDPFMPDDLVAEISAKMLVSPERVKLILRHLGEYLLKKVKAHGQFLWVGEDVDLLFKMREVN